VESPHFLVQTKRVKPGSISLPELVRLAEEMEGWANTDRSDTAGNSWKDKVGMVGVQLNMPIVPGKGASQSISPVVYILTQAQLAKLFKKMHFDPQGGFPDVQAD
jgi:hypothetical protein